MTLPTIESVYLAVPGSHITDDDAAKAGPVLSQLAQQGRSRAEDIVGAAKRPRSPLHGFFDWDDTSAAHQFRLEQARSLTRSIMIQVVDRDGEAVQTRAFHAVALNGGPKAYVTVRMVAQTPDLQAQVLEEAHRALTGWRDRYAQYRALFPKFEKRFGRVLKAIEGTEKKV